MGFKNYIYCFLAVCASVYCPAQDIPIGQWRMHLSYKQGVVIARGNGKIYCATQGGLFSYNESDNSLEEMSKLNGLSDLSVCALNFDQTTNSLVIAYKNSNIDIIQNGVIINLPDIKIKYIQGNKSVNNIYFRSGLAYLACGFGIVVVDLNKHETKETYYIGPSGSSINVRDVNSDGTKLFAATDKGIYTAPLNSSNLADFNSWTKEPGLPNAVFNTLAYYNGYIYANKVTASTWQRDTIYKYDGLSWIASAINGDNFKRLRVFNNTLVAVGENYMHKYNAGETQFGSNYFNYGFGNAWIADGFIDQNDNAWIADLKYGLVKAYPNGTAENPAPNGPRTTAVFSMSSSNNKVWMTPGGVSSNWGANVFNTDGVSVFSDNNWATIFGKQPGASMDSLHDVVAIAIDPDNSNHAFASSFLHGVLEFNNGSMVKLYNPTNSTLESQKVILTYYAVRASGIAYDDDGNLWVGNSETNKILSVRKKNGTWQAIDFSNYVNIDRVAFVVSAKVSGQKWVVLNSANSIVVYNNNGGFAAPNNSNTKRISNIPLNINGNTIAALPTSNPLPGNLLKCIAEDKDGAMWIGSDAGLAVIYSPENIFGGGGWEPQQILVQQDGHTQILLETEIITAIAVDGANRKWIGTQKSGVFLMSPDGTKQIFHFDETNSPLLSNEINCITINNESGEVFFGTPTGIISYKSTATEGGEDFKDVYAYPNPVKHDYTGPIAIKGLLNNADVKITDITGTLIYQTKALGGQAIWDGKNFKGERAHTGVYLVLCTNDDGTKTHVTKILFIN